ncbi:hypothetical protein ACIBAI_26665 [Streptomyces sp. NPDC051041]|uniref:hypothetical protein n=1 Tax=Streptomyces sp. NPDC051041 TaxID=3365640 RepID=UPI0037B4F1B5
MSHPDNQDWPIAAPMTWPRPNLLQQGRPQAIWFPGNHERWTHPQDAVHARGAARDHGPDAPEERRAHPGERVRRPAGRRRADHRRTPVPALRQLLAGARHHKAHPASPFKTFGAPVERIQKANQGGLRSAHRQITRDPKLPRPIHQQAAVHRYFGRELSDLKRENAEPAQSLKDIAS